VGFNTRQKRKDEIEQKEEKKAKEDKLQVLREGHAGNKVLNTCLSFVPIVSFS